MPADCWDWIRCTWPTRGRRSPSSPPRTRTVRWRPCGRIRWARGPARSASASTNIPGWWSRAPPSAVPGWWISLPANSFRGSAERPAGSRAGDTMRPTMTVSPPREGARVQRARRRGVTGMAVTVVALHVAGWGLLAALVVPAHYAVGNVVFGAGLGVTAYTLGMRHAFDVDHIAAIDNTTRKLVGERRTPVSVGFWFSLGHSTVVFVMVGALALGARVLASGVEDDGSGLRRWTGTFGSGVSGTFLLLIGLLNL